MDLSFKQSSKIGDEGSEHIADWLEQQGYIVTSVEKHKGYQEQDIDFIVNKLSKDGKTETTTVELKTDTYTSGNFFFETVRNTTKHTAGCITYTNSDKLVYYFIKTNEIYVFTTWKLRKYLIVNMHRFEEKEHTTIVGNDSYKSRGVIIPKVVIERELRPFKSKYGGGTHENQGTSNKIEC